MAVDDEIEREVRETDALASKTFLVFLFVGLTLVVVGMIIILLATVPGGDSAGFGGVIFIGPFPIVFGFGSNWNWLVTIGVALAVLSIAMFVIMCRKN